MGEPLKARATEPLESVFAGEAPVVDLINARQWPDAEGSLATLVTERGTYHLVLSGHRPHVTFRDLRGEWWPQNTPHHFTEWLARLAVEVSRLRK